MNLITKSSAALLLLLFVCPIFATPPQSPGVQNPSVPPTSRLLDDLTSDPPVVVLVKYFNELRSKNQTEKKVAEGAVIYNLRDSFAVPRNSAYQVTKIRDFIAADEGITLWPEENRTVTVYVLPRDLFIKTWIFVADQARKMQLLDADDHKHAIASSPYVLGFFIPINISGQYVVVLWEWQYWTIFHELVHHAMTVQAGMDIGTSHAATDKKLATIWRRKDVQNWLDEITQR